MLNEFVKVRQRLNVIYLHKKLKILQFLLLKHLCLVKHHFTSEVLYFRELLSTTTTLYPTAGYRGKSVYNFYIFKETLFIKLLRKALWIYCVPQYFSMGPVLAVYINSKPDFTGTAKLGLSFPV